MGHRFIRIFPWLLTVLIFAFILHRVPLGDVYAALSQAPFLTFFALILPYSIFYTMMDALCSVLAVPFSLTASMPMEYKL